MLVMSLAVAERTGVAGRVAAAGSPAGSPGTTTRDDGDDGAVENSELSSDVTADSAQGSRGSSADSDTSASRPGVMTHGQWIERERSVPPGFSSALPSVIAACSCCTSAS